MSLPFLYDFASYYKKRKYNIIKHIFLFALMNRAHERGKEVHTIVPNKVDCEGPDWKISWACWRYLFGGGPFSVPFFLFLGAPLGMNLDVDLSRGRQFDQCMVQVILR